MKKPWQVGILSIFPGLGLFALSEVRQGIIAFVIVAFFVLLGIFVPVEDVAIACYTLAFIAWASQIYYAILIARRKIRLPASPNSPSMQAQAIPASAGSSPNENYLKEAKQDLQPLLQPGEYLKVALPGVVDAPSMLSTILNIVLSLLSLSPVVTSKEGEHIYLGITENDLLRVSTDALLKPDEIRRIPLSQVRLAEHSEGLLADVIVIDTGEGKPLRVSVGHHYQAGTRQLAGYLPRTRASTVESVQVAESPRTEQAVAALAPAKPLAQIVTQHSAIKASSYLGQAGISAIALLAGYAIGFSLFHRMFTGGDPVITQTVEAYGLHAICCAPTALPLAAAIAALVVLAQSRFKFSVVTARLTNGIACLVIGLAGYIPFQLLLILGASF